MTKRDLYNNYFTSYFSKAHPTNKLRDDFEHYAKYFRANYAKYLPKDRGVRIVDLGCGLGHFLYFLKKSGYKNSSGVDISKEEIAICRRFGFRVECADILQFLRKHKNSFDVIILNDVIEHFTNDDVMELLKLAREVLRPKGIFLIKTVNAANPALGSSNRYIDFTHETCFTEESLRQACLLADFSQVMISKLNIYVYPKNPLNYPARLFASVLHRIWRTNFYLHGRKTTHIFTKDMLAICQK